MDRVVAGVGFVCVVAGVSGVGAQDRIAVLGLDAPPDLLTDAEGLAFAMEDAASASGAEVVFSALAIDAAMEDADCTLAGPRCLRSVAATLDADVVVFGFVQREDGDTERRLAVVRVYDRCANEIRSAVVDASPEAARRATLRLLRAVPEPPAAVMPVRVAPPERDGDGEGDLGQWALGLGLGSIAGFAASGLLYFAIDTTHMDDGALLGFGSATLVLTIASGAAAVSAIVLALMDQDRSEADDRSLPELTPVVSANGASLHGAVRF